MKTGLVLGKFLPLHKGHIELINFAQEYCDELTVLVCSTTSETIPGETRLKWIKDYYRNNKKVKPVCIVYDESVLPNTSVSSREVSQKWADYLKSKFPPFDFVFSSENYGEFLAEYLNSIHIPFNLSKNIVPISGTLIRQNSLKYWDYLPENVKPYFVKKICLVGTESTGKSVLTEKLAKHFNTNFVPEMAREIIEKTFECKQEHLIQIAELHAKTIIEKTKTANRLLFVDTDINITKSYSRFLFAQELNVKTWVEEANRFDLYLYLEKEIEFIQDGTRLNKNQRELLDISHQKIFDEKKIKYVRIEGTWKGRFQKASAIVSQLIKANY